LTGAVVERTQVSVRFLLGRLELLTSEVMRLSPGRVLTLEAPLARRVDVQVDGVSIGQGELVDIEGTRGVRLLRVDDVER